MTSTGTFWEGEASAEPQPANEPLVLFRFRRRLFQGFAVLSLAIVLGSAAAGQEADAPTSPPVPAVPDTGQTNAAEELARKRKLRIAIVTGGLIAVTGMAMVALTILGGSATRRGLRRKPLTEGPPPPEPIPAERFDESEGANPGPSPPQPGDAIGGDKP